MAGLAGSAASPERSPVENALMALATVERVLVGSVRASTFLSYGRVALRPGCGDDEIDVGRLSDPLLRQGTRGEPETIRAESRACAIVVGKFSRPDHLKARAYLPLNGRPTTVKLWVASGDQPSLGRRERDVRRRIAGIPEYRAPRLVGDGALGGIEYLVEETVYGRPPVETAARLAAIEDLVPALAGAYASYGLSRRPLEEVAHADFADRVDAALTDGTVVWDDAWGARRDLMTSVDGLIERNRQLVCSLGHGDLVLTNIIGTDLGGHVLTDWEHGKEMPVAFDLGKLLFMTSDPIRATRLVETPLRRLLRIWWDGYGWDEQIALGICRFLSWLPQRRQRAEAVGRVDILTEQARRRVEWLAHLLGP